jgi:hypothetical protein
MDVDPLDNPIIVIGTGRCGTTVVFEALCHHEQLAWFSNYNDRFPRAAWISVAPRVYNLPLLRRLPRGEKPQHRQGASRFNRILPKPSECYRKWELLCGRKFRRDFLVATSASPEERNRTRRAVRAAINWQGKQRFAAKITGPPRIEYLHSIFPEARFIHIVRDPVAVIGSWLKVGFWKNRGGYERPMWDNGLPPGWERQWECYGRSPVALAAMQYRAIFDICGREKRLLPPNRYIEINYEDFVASPVEQTAKLLDFCGLPPSASLLAHVSAPERYLNMNSKHQGGFTSEERGLIREILAPKPVTSSSSA